MPVFVDVSGPVRRPLTRRTAPLLEGAPMVAAVRGRTLAVFRDLTAATAA